MKWLRYQRVISLETTEVDQSHPPWAQFHDHECRVIQCQSQCLTIGLKVSDNSESGSMKVCNYKSDHCNGHKTCETLTLNKTYKLNPCHINLSLSSLPQLKNLIVCRVGPCISNQLLSWKKYTQYAGDSGILLDYGKLTMVKLTKSSRLSYNWIVR
jgi:hypothetical protein